MGYLLSSYQLFQPHVFWSEAVLQGLQISHGVTYIGRLSPAGMSTLDQILRLNCCTPLYGYRQKWSCSCRGVTTLWCWHGSCVRLRHDARPFTFTEWNNGSPQPTSEWLWSRLSWRETYRGPRSGPLSLRIKELPRSRHVKLQLLQLQYHWQKPAADE